MLKFGEIISFYVFCNKPFAGQGHVTMSIIKIGGSTKCKNEKSMMKLVRVLILRLLLLKREIL